MSERATGRNCAVPISRDELQRQAQSYLELAVKLEQTEIERDTLLKACDAAETMLRCLPDTNTNASGAKPTMTTLRALAMVRSAMGLVTASMRRAAI